jgi:hypothetical protein
LDPAMGSASNVLMMIYDDDKKSAAIIHVLLA